MYNKNLLFIVIFGLTITLALTLPLPISNTNHFISEAFAQPSISSNVTTLTNEELNNRMAELSASDNPEDIATLAYIWGFPLVSVIRSADYTTSPNIPPGDGRGPENTFNPFRTYPDANFTDYVRPNVDTLYSTAFGDLKKEPLVLQVPPISDRYYSLQFADAYQNNFFYIGSRTNVTEGGTYFISGPNWNGTIPSGMKEIKAPTDTVYILIRILVDGPEDVSTVHSIQDNFILNPISMFSNDTTTNTGDTTALSSPTDRLGSNASQADPIPPDPALIPTTGIPIPPDPALIPTTGIKIYDEISKYIIDNPPFMADSNVLAKFETIGIGPGKTPSSQTNDTIKQALQTGITEGEKLIDAKLEVIGLTVNGWRNPGMTTEDGETKTELGDYGTDYLLRAAVTKHGIFANSPEEAVYPTAFTDSQGQSLTGANSYVIHFDKGQAPPVNAFWSLTMYNNASYLADNPINRYSIGDRTPGLKYNEDGSLDIYIQHDNPGPDKESNWLPAPAGDFSVTMRLYNPQDSILKGEYQFPPVQRVTG